MGNIVNFNGANFVFKAPAGRDDIADLPCFRNDNATVCCIQLTPAELEQVNRTGQVWVTHLYAGDTFYPLFVGSEHTVRSVVIDYGKVWER